jgi:hypothetical protein
MAEEPDCRVQEAVYLTVTMSRCEQPLWRCHCLSQFEMSPSVCVIGDGDVPSSLDSKECGQS